MSGFVALPKFILQNSSLTPDSIVLYANLLHFDRGGGRGCFCKRETLSRFSNLSLHKIRNAIKVLEDNGVISVVRRRNSLTDVIKITPDSRPPIKESRRSIRKPVSKPRNTQEVKEVNNGYECGIIIENYSDIKINDTIETFEVIETARKL